jgi:hypothetical protein
VSDQHNVLAIVPLGKSPCYLLNRRLHEPYGQSGRFEEEINILPLLGLQPLIVQLVAFAKQFYCKFFHLGL